MTPLHVLAAALALLTFCVLVASTPATAAGHRRAVLRFLSASSIAAIAGAAYGLYLLATGADNELTFAWVGSGLLVANGASALHRMASRGHAAR